MLGALLLGVLLIAIASNDIPAPVPWLYGLMPLGILWLTRRVGLLLGLLAATSTLGAVYAAGVQEPSQLFFVAVLAGSGLCLAACARRGVPASTTLVLAVAPVLLVAAGYLLTGGLDELSRLLTERIEAIRQLESERRVSQTLGISAAEFERVLTQAGRMWNLLLPSLFALKWILVLSINCWLASVLFQDRGGFPTFAEFSTWRVHAVGAWVAAVALALMATRLSPAVEAGVNLAFPLAIAYAIQGFAVLRFLAIAYEVRPAVQIASLILVGLAPILVLPLVLGIGFFDAWFDFRRRAVQGFFGPRGGRGGDE
ncbi:MAG TPA: DUF2232 domain-containing protein [Candidatus Eisenbacteria bacterium]|nr:DUF2232 domain-containing protein [Candidatus Eisenbacteria bacterium]